MALLTTPAPDLAAVATKLQVIHRDGYQHELAPVLADVERMAGLERGLADCVSARRRDRQARGS